VGTTWRRVYVPLRISQSGPADPTNSYVLALYPGVKLREVYLTLGAADSLGRPIEGMLIKDHEPQEHGFYPAERPIRIRIPRLEPPGLYYVEVSATLPDGAPVPVAPVLIDTGGS
jgi:hypothetical protein